MSISTSEATAALEREIDAAADGIDQLVIDGRAGELSAAHLTRLIAAAAKAYDVMCEAKGTEFDPVGRSVSTTEAVRLAVALARSQNLSAFDLALWFRHVEPGNQ